MQVLGKSASGGLDLGGERAWWVFCVGSMLPEVVVLVLAGHPLSFAGSFDCCGIIARGSQQGDTLAS